MKREFVGSLPGMSSREKPFEIADEEFRHRFAFGRDVSIGTLGIFGIPKLALTKSEFGSLQPAKINNLR